MFIVSYINIPFFFDESDIRNTFQIILYEASNDIRVNYRDVSPRDTSSNTTTAGIENAQGTVGLQYERFKTPGRYMNISVRYYTGSGGEPGPAPEPEPSPLPVSDLFPKGSLFFPSIVVEQDWKMELCVINPDSEQTGTGVLRAYDQNGGFVGEVAHLSIPPRGRYAVSIVDLMGMYGSVAYMVFEPDSGSPDLVGYERFTKGDDLGDAIPGATEPSSYVLDIPHIASDLRWFTRIELINTAPGAQTIDIQFDSGETVSMGIEPGQHKSFLVRDLFGGDAKPEIHSARISGSGLIGMEFFGRFDVQNVLSSILLGNEKDYVIYYPHIVDNGNWYSGLVAFTYASSCDLAITPFTAVGESLPLVTKNISRSSRYVGTSSSLELPKDTAWLKVQGSTFLSGFELFGSHNGSLAGFVCTGINRKTGVFPSLNGEGVTEIGIINTENSETHVVLTAYGDDGIIVAEKTLHMAAYEKKVGEAQDLFDQDISGATYMAFSSDNEIVGFQINVSIDEGRADALPNL
jgi:hypothetical protein